MQITHITADRREEWNAFVARESSFALLQSWEWGDFKEKLGWTAFRIAVEKCGQIIASAQMLIKPLPFGLASIAYIPRGPVGNWLDKAVTPMLFSELHQVARQFRAIFLKIEPVQLHEPTVYQVLQEHHFRASAYTNQPRTTIIADVQPDLDDILSQMRKKTRQYIRYASRKGVTIDEGGQEDLPTFYELMQLTARRGQFSPRVSDYYKHQWQAFANNDQAVLLMACYRDQVLAARMVFCFGAHAAEFHACSSGKYRNLRPDYLLVWAAIKWAKACGCKTYDLWGIPDEVGQAVYEGKDPLMEKRLNGLWGVYQFKRGFSKNVVYYVSGHDYVYSPLLYTMIMNTHLNRKLLDRGAIWMDSLGGV